MRDATERRCATSMILAVLTKSDFIAFFLAPTIGENPSSGRSGVSGVHQGVSLSHPTVMEN